MKKIDYSKNGGLKFTQQIAEFMQDSYTEMFNAFGRAFGNKVVLTGCVISSGNISNGVILFNGEPIIFEGGTMASYIAISEITENVMFKNGINYPIKITKKATVATAGDFATSELVRVRSIATLDALATSINNSLAALVSAYNAHTHLWGAIEGKPSGYITYAGTQDIGNVTSSLPYDRTVDVTIPDQGGSNYKVVGCLVGFNSDPNYDNDVSFVINAKTATSFKISLRKYENVTTDLKFDFAIIKTL